MKTKKIVVAILLTALLTSCKEESAVIKFEQIQEKYQLTPMFFEFSETIQFMRNCKDLFYKRKDEENDSI